MRKFAAGLVKKRGGEGTPSQITTNGTPEENVSRGVRLFCESGGPNDPSSESQEYLHLPTIVDSAESSPAAAKAAAYQIRKTLKENYSKPYVQYNAIMLIRILADNPGPSFTKNMDDKFVTTIETLLRQGRDQSVQQLLMETLYSLESGKAYDDNLLPLMAMWRKERATIMQRQGATVSQPTAQWAPLQQQPQRQRQRSRKQLPSPAELAGRIEESRMSAQLLSQVTQSTPTAQLFKSDLAREFAERCQNSQQTLQSYMNCTDPAPDEQTFQTLIEVSEQLNVAANRYQRALLAARRESSTSPAPIPEQPTNRLPASPPPNVPARPRYGTVKGPSSTQPQAQSRNPYYALNEAQPTSLYPPSANAAPTRSSTQPIPDSNQLANNPVPTSRSALATQPQASNVTSAQTATALPSSFELPLSRTPPLGPTILGPINSISPNELSYNNDYEPPPGPPPNRQSTQPTDPDSARPPTEGSDDLYASNSPLVEKRSPVSSPAESDPRSSLTLNQYSEPNHSPATQQQQEAAPTNPFVSPEDAITPGSVNEAAVPSVQAPTQSTTRLSPPTRDAEKFPPQNSVSTDITSSASTGAGGLTTRAPAEVRDDDPLTPMSASAWRSGEF